MKDMGTRISTLWIVVMFNMVFADILTFITPGELQALWAGQAGVPITPGLLLVFAILMEIPIAMIFVSRVLKPRANRWANTVAAVVTTAFVVGGGSLTLALRVLRGRGDRVHGADRLVRLGAAQPSAGMETRAGTCRDVGRSACLTRTHEGRRRGEEPRRPPLAVVPSKSRGATPRRSPGREVFGMVP